MITYGRLYNYIKNIISSIENNHLIISHDNTDFCLILSQQIAPKLAINSFIDDWYYQKEETEKLISTKNSLLKTISNLLKKYSKRLENINAKLNDCKNMDIYKLYGELITSNLYQYANQNLDSIVVENYYNSNALLTIPLNKSITVNKNAEKYFKKYHKLKNAFSVVSLQKEETKIELDYIESLIYSIENSNSLLELEEIIAELYESKIILNKRKQIKTSKTKDKYISSEPLKFNIDGFTVLAGKNNHQNDMLSLKIASKNDIWFHVKNVQGSHVILRTENKPIDVSTLKKCAKIAVENSKARHSSNVAVDYCEAKYVKKINGAKPRYDCLYKLQNNLHLKRRLLFGIS